MEVIKMKVYNENMRQKEKRRRKKKQRKGIKTPSVKLMK
jgi:hypothetical protein